MNTCQIYFVFLSFFFIKKNVLISNDGNVVLINESLTINARHYHINILTAITIDFLMLIELLGHTAILLASLDKENRRILTDKMFKFRHSSS